MAELTMLFEAVISKNAFLMYLQQLRQRDWKTVLSLGDKVTGTGDTIAICCLCLRTFVSFLIQWWSLFHDISHGKFWHFPRSVLQSSWRKQDWVATLQCPFSCSWACSFLTRWNTQQYHIPPLGGDKEERQSGSRQHLTCGPGCVWLSCSREWHLHIRSGN